MQNLFQLKSRTLFIDAFNGVLDVSISGSDRLEVRIIDTKRYEPITSKENAVRILVDGKRQSGFPEGYARALAHLRPDKTYEISWCGMVIGGVFRRKMVDGETVWIVQPKGACKPYWWDAENWLHTVTTGRKEVRDLLVPA